ncbi:MAG TPA: histidinol-phosphatase [Verrucomicrobiota bacterium]|nr:histidinol-phosphatase [Verrucomicrobiota bacterium]
MKIKVLFTIIFALAASTLSAGDARWWKGNLHTHSLWSDGDDYPEMIADWYRSNGYHFLGISDHNVLAESERWIHREKNAGGQRAFDKYLKHFGDEWVEHKVVKGVPQVRLKTFAEYKAKIAVPGSFLLMQSEELSDQFQGKPIHINVTNIKKQIPPQGGAGVAATMQKNIDAVLAQRKATGQPMFPHINHPNFGWAIQPADMIQLRGEQFFEVYNGHPAVNNYGDKEHLSTGQIWDVINAYRLGVHKLPLLLGLGTDDAHNYHDLAVGQSNTGRGWVMVRAESLTAESLIAAMERGDFYASSGVTVDAIHLAKGKYSFRIQPEAGVTYTTWFVGTRKNFKSSSDLAKRNSLKPAQAGIGEILGQSKSLEPSYTFKGDELYIRAEIVASKKKANPYAAGEHERAWLQPVRSGK